MGQTFNFFFAGINPTRVLLVPRIPLWDFFLQNILQLLFFFFFFLLLSLLPLIFSLLLLLLLLGLWLKKKKLIGLLSTPKEAQWGKPLTFFPCWIFCRKKPHKGTLGVENTFAGIIFAKKKKKDVGEVEGRGRRGRREKGGRRRKRKRKKKRKRKQRTCKMFCKKTNLARVLSTLIIPL